MIHVIKKYLDLNNFSESKEDFEDFFQSHPNYPSLFAVTDSLDLLSIENLAIKLPKEQFVELPDFFVAFFQEDLVLVNKTSESLVIERENKEKATLSYNSFLEKWNGIILVMEPNEKAATVVPSKNNNWIKYSLPFLGLIALSFFNSNYAISSILLLATSLFGLLISVFIVQEKFGIKNEIASKFCNINPNASCDSVIKSEKSDINKWLSFADLPFLFFSVSVLSILLQPNFSSLIVGVLSVLSIPVVLYSIWVQKFQLKKWCVLCLAISIILIAQGVLFASLTTSFYLIQISNLFAFIFSLVAISSLWMLVKPMIESKIKAENSTTDLKKFKRNTEVFNFLSKKVTKTQGFNKLQGISFGNQSADVQLTIILSPSCGHCHKAFEDGFELAQQFPEKIHLNVLFNINPENNDNPYKVVVEGLLAIQYNNPEKVAEAISDWHIKKIGLELWLQKWQIETIDMRVNQQIHLQYQWCLDNDFNFTPVKIVNEKQFPNQYEISELKYFLNTFSSQDEVSREPSLVEA
jgi:uncharacterized membrane protein